MKFTNSIGTLITQNKYCIPAIIGVLSLALYYWSFIKLDQDFNFGLIGILAIPSLIYMWFYRNNKQTESLKQRKTSIILLIYSLLYFISIFFLNILGSSFAYWLVQFLMPIIILKLCDESLSSIFFKWNAMFSDIRYVLFSAIILVPFLVFEVRDSEQIIILFHSWKIIIYLPLSILYMLITAAFWEEFFFRGIIQNSILKLTNNASISIFLSALFFSIYHIPMRYLNVKSEYYGDLLSSIAGTINEQFIMGLFLGLVVYKSKNIWHGIWLHSILNGISFVHQLSLMFII